MGWERVGESLRRLRLAHGLTLREAAPKCGISYGQLHAIEQGQNTTLDTVSAVASAYNANIDVRVRSTEFATPTPDRMSIAQRFMRILPNLTDAELTVLLEELALWETDEQRRENVG